MYRNVVQTSVKVKEWESDSTAGGEKKGKGRGAIIQMKSGRW